MQKESIKTKEEFLLELQECIRKELGEEYCVTAHETEKLNGVVKETLLIRRIGYECAPSFYVEEMYQSYCEGMPVELLSEQIANVIRRETEEKKEIAGEICSREWLEQNIYVRLINYEANEALLTNSIFIRKLDLAIVFYVLTEQGEDGIRSYRLLRPVWEKAGFGAPEDYLSTAIENTRRLFPECRIKMESFLKECLKKRGMEAPMNLEEVFGKETPLLLILSNQQKINGSAVIFYPGFLERLEKEYGEFYLIPSSIHEILLIRAEEGLTEAEMNLMVKEVNETQVEAEEVLSDHIYYYSADTGLCSR